jgi:hypothetical protein
MPFLIKTTFAFAGAQQGWSETFYWQSPDGNLSVAENLVTPLMQKRARLLSNGYEISVVRNGVVQDAGGGRVLRQTDLFEPHQPGVVAWLPATPNLCLLCVEQTFDNRKSKKLYMRGIPAGLGDSGKLPDLGFASWGTSFQSWRQAMIDFPTGWLTSAPTASAIVTTYSVDVDTGQVTFTLTAPGFVTWPVPFGVQTAVYCKFPGKSPLDGKLIVVPTTATSCFTAAAHPAAPLPIGQVGTMQLRASSFVSLAPGVPQGPQGVIHPQRIISHKTGRPTYASRGRSVAKVRF